MKKMMDYLVKNPKKVRKFIVALLGAVAVGIAEGVLPEDIGTWVTVITPFLTAYGVYRVPNEKVAEYEGEHRAL